MEFSLINKNMKSLSVPPLLSLIIGTDPTAEVQNFHQPAAHRVFQQQSVSSSYDVYILYVYSYHIMLS